jgi:hypothetical protein
MRSMGFRHVDVCLRHRLAQACRQLFLGGRSQTTKSRYFEMQREGGQEETKKAFTISSNARHNSPTALGGCTLVEPALVCTSGKFLLLEEASSLCHVHPHISWSAVCSFEVKREDRELTGKRIFSL